MTDLLRRNLAPFSTSTWQRVDAEVKDALDALLTARRVVDFQGPHGYTHSAVSLGHLVRFQSDEGVGCGVRSVLPMTEVRIDFALRRDELDNIDRGALEVDLEPARQAARRFAAFEEKLVYLGLEPAQVHGIVPRTLHQTVALGEEPSDYISAIAQAMQVLVASGVGGPYALVLSPAPYRSLVSDVSAYPLRQRVANLAKGPILQCPHMQGGLLVSMRGGDFQLDVGQDVSVGYASHDAERIGLFLLATMTFRVLDSGAAVKLA